MNEQFFNLLSEHYPLESPLETLMVKTELIENEERRRKGESWSRGVKAKAAFKPTM